TIVAAALILLGGFVGRMYLRAQALRPAMHRNLSLPDLQPFLRSWAIWLGNRGEILVRHEGTNLIVHFRKRTYKHRHNVLFFRYPNVDERRGSFPIVHAALEAAGVPYEIERTRGTRKPRALVVALDPADVLMPAAATRLVDTVFTALGVGATPGFLIW